MTVLLNSSKRHVSDQHASTSSRDDGARCSTESTPEAAAHGLNMACRKRDEYMMKVKTHNNRAGTFPLTASQRQMYTGQLLDPDSPLYNTIITNTLYGDISPSRFKQAWDTVVAANSALRARFVIQSGEPVQYFESSVEPIQLLDYSLQADAEEASEAWITKDAQRRFDLSTSVYSAALIKLQPDKWIWYCNQHHLITDALSFQSIWSQFCEEYASSVTSRSTGDFRQYLENTIEGDPLHSTHNTISDNATRHWLERGDASPVTMYHGKPSSATTRSFRVKATLSNGRVRALNTLVQTPEARSLNTDISKTVVLMATMYCFLYRTSNQNSLTIGSPTAYRSNGIHKETAGPFFEVLPLQTHLEPSDTFADVLKKTRAEIMNWLRYAEKGASEIAGQSAINVIVNFIFARMKNLGDIRVETEWRHPEHADRHHALRLHVADWQSTGKLTLCFDFNEACFNDSLRQTAISQWWSLFDAMSSDPQTLVGAVDIAGSTTQYGHPDESPTEQIAGLPDAPLYQQTNVVDHVLHACDLYSRNIAVTQSDDSLDYEHLAYASSKLANELGKLGIGQGDRVCTFIEHSISLPSIILGILKTGAAYVPIEPSLPDERIRFIYTDSSAKLVITQKNLVSKLGANYHYLVADSDDLPDSSAQSPPSLPTRPLLTGDCPVISPSSTAYIMYTSGSTGNPKGVIVSHKALYNYCHWAANFYCQDQALTFPLFTSLSFDLTVTSLFPPLMCGSRIRVYKGKSGEHQTTLFSVIEENLVDIIKLTPAHLMLLRDVDFSSSRISQIIVGGDDLRHHLASTIYHSFNGNVLIHNEYGPTEATVGCILNTFHPEDVASTSVPIGQPVAGMQAWILNEHLQVQPDGVSGEIHLSGPALSDGYWNNPALTSDSFVSCDALSQGKLYKTGDMARRQVDGKLIYLGRRDDQIKSNGVRIEPGEIEAAMTLHSRIDACHVMNARETTITEDEVFCSRCAISSRVPGVVLNQSDICTTCEKYEQYRQRASTYFRNMDQLLSIADRMKQAVTGQYDCMMLLSGGKDSTYALARLADMDLRVLAFTLDNGFISPEAKTNISRVCNALGVDHVYGSTQHMNRIFADSLDRHSNVCHGCFKTIYTLSMKMAEEQGIPFIVTGLSRGQFFETRLTEELFTSSNIDIDDIDDFVLTARKAYHKVDDAVHRLLDVSQFDDEHIFEKITFIDFYRYCDVNLDEMMSYLDSRVPWVRPSDTGRSTNCLINDVGIYVHKKERGFHNYAVPYSWDVRLGHKNRDAALHELSDDIDENHVHHVLKEIGYQCKDSDDFAETSLVAYYMAETTLSAPEIREWLSDRLPANLIPGYYVQVDSFPLNANGKIIRDELPPPLWKREGTHKEYRPARTELEALLVDVWQAYLNLSTIGLDDNFFELGGDSLTGIKIISRLNNLGHQFTPAQLFESQTIAKLAALFAERIEQTPADNDAGTTAFSALKPGQLDKLGQLLNR